MNQVDSVLVATDFSEAAQHAVDGAISLAKTFKAKLHVVHAQTPASPATAVLRSAKVKVL